MKRRSFLLSALSAPFAGVLSAFLPRQVEYPIVEMLPPITCTKKGFTGSFEIDWITYCGNEYDLMNGDMTAMGGLSGATND